MAEQDEEEKLPEQYKVGIKVISKKGTCRHGHEVGDKWVADGKTPGGICLVAFNSISPRLQVLMFGGAFPVKGNPDITEASCPSPNLVVFELLRFRE